jgi:hypothetical protein
MKTHIKSVLDIRLDMSVLLHPWRAPLGCIIWVVTWNVTGGSRAPLQHLRVKRAHAWATASWESCVDKLRLKTGFKRKKERRLVTSHDWTSHTFATKAPHTHQPSSKQIKNNHKTEISRRCSSGPTRSHLASPLTGLPLPLQIFRHALYRCTQRRRGCGSKSAHARRPRERETWRLATGTGRGIRWSGAPVFLF